MEKNKGGGRVYRRPLTKRCQECWLLMPLIGARSIPTWFREERKLSVMCAALWLLELLVWDRLLCSLLALSDSVWASFFFISHSMVIIFIFPCPVWLPHFPLDLHRFSQCNLLRRRVANASVWGHSPKKSMVI